jgi:CRISPR/Cas system-associated exonuclease Cas4 (RecB family)
MKVPNLVQALDMGLQVIEAEDNRDNSRLHVTDLAATIPGEGCPRQLWLQLRGSPKRTKTAGQLLMLRNAKRIHDDLTEIFKKGLPREWDIVGVETKLEFDGIIGTADLFVRNAQSGQHIVIDYKTSRGRAFYYLSQDNKPKPAHELQVRTYMYGASRMWPNMNICDTGLVYHVDREGQNASLQFPVTRNDEAVKQAIAEAKEIVAMEKIPDMIEPVIKLGKETKTLGVPVNIALSWMCDYCDYRDVSCHSPLIYDHRSLGVVGHMVAGDFKPKKETPLDVIDWVEHLAEIPF